MSDTNPFPKSKPALLPALMPVKSAKVWSSDNESVDTYRKATRQVAFFQKLLDFMPQAELSWYEQSGEKERNDEDVTRANYVDYRGKLNKARWNSDKVYYTPNEMTVNENNKFITSFKSNYHGGDGDFAGGRNQYGQTHRMYDQTNVAGTKLVSGYANTWSHNLNMYNGARSWNPFKHSSRGNPRNTDRGYAQFNDDPELAKLNNQFMSPMNAIRSFNGRDIWAQINDTVLALESGSGLNLDDSSDPYTFARKGINTFDIKANYYEMGMNVNKWKDWTDEQCFSFLMQSWEAKKRGFKAYQEVWGRVYDMPNPEQTIDWLSDAAGEIVKQDLQLGRSKQMHVEMQDWYADVAGKLHNKTMLLPFKLMAMITHQTDYKLDAWGFWGSKGALYDSNYNMTAQGVSGVSGGDMASDFQTKMVRGYLKYYSSPSGSILGTLSSQFNAIPGLAAIKLKDAQVPATDVPFLSRLEGTFNFSNAAGIKATDLYNRARQSYNFYFDVFEQITGIDLQSGKDKKYAATISSLMTTGTDGKVTLTLQKGNPAAVWKGSEAEARALINGLRQTISFLEPVVAGFDPVSGLSASVATYENANVAPGTTRPTLTRVLIDNSGSTDFANTITESNQGDYVIQVDYVPHGNTATAPPDMATHRTDDYAGVRGYDKVITLPGMSEDWGTEGKTIESALGGRTNTNVSIYPFLDTWTNKHLIKREHISRTNSLSGQKVALPASSPFPSRGRGSSPDGDENWARAAWAYMGGAENAIALDVVGRQQVNRGLKKKHSDKKTSWMKEKEEWTDNNMQIQRLQQKSLSHQKAEEKRQQQKSIQSIKKAQQPKKK